MHLNIDDGFFEFPTSLIVRTATEERLSTTHFRPADRPLAGNFALLRNARQLLLAGASESLVEHAHSSLTAGLHRNRVTIKAPELIGWSGTDCWNGYNVGAVEYFEPSPRSVGLRVKRHRYDIEAPATNLITMAYEVKNERGTVVIVIHTIYPGPDVGQLRGDVSAKNNCVFFDWDHPGEPI